MIKFNKIKDYKTNMPVIAEVFYSFVDSERFSIPYLWGISLNNEIYYGREINDFINTIITLSQNNDNVIIYSFELRMLYASLVNVFEGYKIKKFSKGTKILNFTIDNVEFRALNSLIGNCSFEDFNRIDVNDRFDTFEFTKKYGISKLDYVFGIKTPNTVLPRFETNRIEVVCQREAEFINSLYNIFGISIPLTVSGISKSIIANECFKDGQDKYQRELGKFDKYDKSTTMPIHSLDHFYFLRRCFAGGYVGLNKNYKNKTVEDVTGVDFTSHYISCLLRNKYPIKYLGSIRDFSNEDKVEYNLQTNWCLVWCKLKDFRLKDGAVCRPLRNLKGRYTKKNDKDEYELTQPLVVFEDSDNIVYDGNEIVSAASLSFRGAYTDLESLSWFYEWSEIKYEYIEVYQKAYLPEGYCNAVKSLFRGKSINKNNPQRFKEVMSKTLVLITWGLFTTGFFAETEHELFKEIKDYNEFHNAFVNRTSCYQWGIACTAYARYSLLNLIDIIGEDWIYSDTDSMYIKNYKKWAPVIAAFNNFVDEETLANPYVTKDDICIKSEYANPITRKKKTYHLGHLIVDSQCKKFKVLKPKTYLKELDDGSLDLKMSGVSNIRTKFFETVDDPFEWFTLKDFDNNIIPKEYCDYYGTLDQFDTKTFTVTDIFGKEYSGHLSGGPYKSFKGYSLGSTNYITELINEVTSI